MPFLGLRGHNANSGTYIILSDNIPQNHKSWNRAPDSLHDLANLRRVSQRIHC